MRLHLNAFELLFKTLAVLNRVIKQCIKRFATYAGGIVTI